MDFEELEEETRKYMLQEFHNEQNTDTPYRSDSMSPEGLQNVEDIVEKALKDGNERTLAVELSNPNYWNPYTTVHRQGSTHQRKINPTVAARVFALTEFNTWYVRGFAKRLIDEGEKNCEVYRAEAASQPRCECSQYEGQAISLKKIYEGHRAKYHPKENSDAFSIPSGPNCHHTIRRIKISKTQ